jgi:hypothetical protein
MSRKVLQAIANAVYFFVQSARPMSFALGALLVGASCGVTFDASVFAQCLLFYDTELVSRYYCCDTSVEFTKHSVDRRFANSYARVCENRAPVSMLQALSPSLSLMLLCRVVNGARFDQLCAGSYSGVSVAELKIALFSILAPVAIAAPELMDLLRTLKEQSANTFDLQVAMLKQTPVACKVRATDRSRVLTGRIGREYRDSIRNGQRTSIHFSFVSNLVLLSTTAAAYRALDMLVAYVLQLDSAEKLHQLYYALTSQRKIPMSLCVRARQVLEETPTALELITHTVAEVANVSPLDSFADIWSPHLTISLGASYSLRRIRGETMPSWLAISVGLHAVHNGPWVDSDALLPSVSTCTRTLSLSPTLDVGRFFAGMDLLCASAGYFSDP